MMPTGPAATALTVLDLVQAGRYAEILDMFAPNLRALVAPGSLDQPILILQGGRDYPATVADDLSRWKAGLADRADTDIATWLTAQTAPA